MLLSSKKIFITAAGQGIGRAITERFIKEKGSVLATDVNYELIKDIETEKKQLDVLNKTELIDEDEKKEKIKKLKNKLKKNIFLMSTMDKKSVSDIKSKLVNYVS